VAIGEGDFGKLEERHRPRIRYKGCGILRVVRTLSASDTTLIIQTPAWIGLACVVLAVVLAIVVVVLRRPRPVRLAAFLGTFVLLYVGWYSLRTTITFETRGFYVEGMRGEEERVGWSQVASIEGGGAPGARKAPASADHLSFFLRSGAEVAVDLTGLSDEEKARVVAFVRARLKR